MVKGISRQVIVVKSPETELFEQAIFILKDSAVREGITDDMLLRQAKEAIGRERRRGRGILLMLLGAALTGLAWGLTLLL